MAIRLKALFEDSSNWKNFYQSDFITRKQRFDKDISGGGFSGQPFVKRAIPSGPGRPIGEYYDLSVQALSLDFPIRGGTYNEIASRDDFQRIDRFFLYYPQGKAFTDKYRGLLRSNPLLESGRSAGDVNTRIFSSVDQGDNIQLGSANLIEQIASVGAGFHIPQAGRDILSLTIPQNLYEQIVAKKPKFENRLVSLYETKIKKPEDIDQGFNLFNSTVVNQGLSTFRQSIQLMDYDGGPGSLYGFGRTLIRKGTTNTGAIINTGDAPLFVGPSTLDLRNNRVQSTDLGTVRVQLDFNDFLGAQLAYNQIPDIKGINDVNDLDYIPNLDQQEGSFPTSDFTSTYAQLMEKGNNNSFSPGNLTVTDFRKQVKDPSKVFSRDYTKEDIDKTTRVGIGNPGARPSNLKTNISDRFIPGEDKVNTYPNKKITKSESSIDGFTILNGNRDLIKFAFEIVDNDSKDFKSEVIFFRAFLTGYSDSHSAEWDAKRYAGRGEEFYTYQGFVRDVNFNFKVAAQSKHEMRFLYSKVNTLVSTLYPDYNSSGFMRGNITKLTIGDLFVRTPGILTSLNLTVDDQYAWEVAMTEPEGGDDKDMLETPQIMDIAVNFKPILAHLPQKAPLTPIILTGNSKISQNYLASAEAGDNDDILTATQPTSTPPGRTNTNFDTVVGL